MGPAVVKNKLGFTAVAVVGALDLKGRLIANEICDNFIDATVFIELLKGISSHYGGRRSYVFVDNLRMHHSAVVKETAAQLNCELIYNAPYSSEFNPIERFWAYSK